MGVLPRIGALPHPTVYDTPILHKNIIQQTVEINHELKKIPTCMSSEYWSRLFHLWDFDIVIKVCPPVLWYYFWYRSVKYFLNVRHVTSFSHLRKLRQCLCYYNSIIIIIYFKNNITQGLPCPLFLSPESSVFCATYKNTSSTQDPQHFTFR